MNENTFVLGRKASVAIMLLVALTWAISLAVVPWAPAQVPTHWELNGEPDRFAAPFPGLFILPMVMAALAVLLRVLPRIDPRKQNYQAFGSTYIAIQIGIMLFLVAMHVITVAAALGMPVNMSLVVMPLVGMLFVGLGNLMGKIRPNWFVGFRTPWALASSDVWTRTHRFGGRLMVGLGLVMIAGGLLLPPAVAVTLLLAGCLAMVIATFGYSYVVWLQLGDTHA